MTIDTKETLTVHNNSKLIIPEDIFIINNGKLIVENGGLIDGDGTIDVRNGYINNLGSINPTLIYKINIIEVTNITFNGEKIISNKKDVNINLKANEGYKLPEKIVIKVGKEELNPENYTYDYATGNLMIPANEITSNIDIIALADLLLEYSITINHPEGATVIPNGDITKVLEGTNVDISINPDPDYRIKSIKVNDIEQSLPLSNNILTVTNIKENLNIIIETKKIVVDNKNDFNSNTNHETNPSVSPKNESNLNSNNKNEVNTTILLENKKDSNLTNKSKLHSIVSPKTGDNESIVLCFVLFIISILGGIGFIKYMNNSYFDKKI